MAKAYSVDLRERVLKHLEDGNTTQSAIRLFSVSIATIFRWIKLKRETNKLVPRKRRCTYRKIDLKKLQEYVEKHPDQYLSEIAKEFSVSIQAIFYALKKLKITRKKRLRFTRKEMKKNESSSLSS